MPESGYQANAGSAEQLPRGAATAANEGVNVEAPAPIEEAPTEAPAPEDQQAVGMDMPMDGEEDLADAAPTDGEPAYEPQSEAEQFITGPSLRPDEGVTAGVTALPNENYIPEDLRRAMPSLVAASQQPGASPLMQTIVAWIVREANR